MTLKANIQIVVPSKDKISEALKIKLGVSAKFAAEDIAASYKKNARAMIARSGKNMKNLENALRVKVFPDKKFAIDPAMSVWVKTGSKNKTGYAALFEEGGTVQGSPYLWIPLPAAQKIFGSRRVSLEAWRKRFGDLVPLRGGARPILGARISTTTVRAGKTKAGNPRKPRSLGNRQGPPVPLFMGVRSVHIPQKWRLTALAASEWSRMRALYKAKL